MSERLGANVSPNAGSIGTNGKSPELPLEAAIRPKTAKLGIIGLGYVGLPLIRTFVGSGFEMLRQKRAVISCNDPHIPRLRRGRRFDIPMESSPLTAEFLASQDCVLIATDHSAIDDDFVVKHSPLVVDTRNATRNVRVGREKICKA